MQISLSERAALSRLSVLVDQNPTCPSVESAIMKNQNSKKSLHKFLTQKIKAIAQPIMTVEVVMPTKKCS